MTHGCKVRNQGNLPLEMGSPPIPSVNLVRNTGCFFSLIKPHNTMTQKEIELLTALKNDYHLDALEKEQAKELLRVLTLNLERRK